MSLKKTKNLTQQKIAEPFCTAVKILQEKIKNIKSELMVSKGKFFRLWLQGKNFPGFDLKRRNIFLYQITFIVLQ